MRFKLTQEKLRELIHYDPETGALIWIVDLHNGVNAGDIAGCVNEGYRRVRIFDKLYLAHHLAWLYMTGEMPVRVDHKDGDGLNNRYKNLRDATHGQNKANSKLSRNNRCGFKGVSLHKGKWRATITHQKRCKHLGYFSTPELAHEFYCLAADLLHGEFANHGVHKHRKTAQ